MDNKQILETAISKAVDGGWKTPYVTLDSKYLAQAIVSGVNRYEVIFNHDFAKALWGNERIVMVKNYQPRKHMGWQYHLQQMVIAENPLVYLGENL